MLASKEYLVLFLLLNGTHMIFIIAYYIWIFKLDSGGYWLTIMY